MTEPWAIDYEHVVLRRVVIDATDEDSAYKTFLALPLPSPSRRPEENLAGCSWRGEVHYVLPLDEAIRRRPAIQTVDPADLMCQILADQCPLDELEDGWMLYEIELHCLTYRIEARMISAPVFDLLPEKDVYEEWKFEIRKIDRKG